MVALGALPFVMACDDDPEPPEQGCRDYADVTPGGSFENDVMPLFARSCALASSCHQGDPGNGQEGLGLGPSNMQGAPDAMQLADIHDQLLNASPVRSTLPYVDPSNPTGSWLMAKIEYDASLLAECSVCTDCGVFMPQGSPSDSGYTRAERDLIAGWILDGAPNN